MNKNEKIAWATIEFARTYSDTLDSGMVLQALLLVADSGSKGIGLGEIAEALKTTHTTASRNCHLLGEHGKRGKPGQGLIVATENPANLRAKLMRLTPKGRDFMQALNSHLEGVR